MVMCMYVLDLVWVCVGVWYTTAEVCVLHVHTGGAVDEACVYTCYP